MKESFEQFYKMYLDSWRNFSIQSIENVVSPEYSAREIRGKEVYDFGYEESIDGWNHAFKELGEKRAKWILKEAVTFSLKDDEVMAILWASLIVDDQPIETANLFFQTFKMEKDSWKLVRSYIETGLSIKKMLSLEFNLKERSDLL
ncbi:flavoprotein [Bacillus sp. E(2018)]|uniref:flavoprotein n=1 Tax=Bacillus sp. E(2018) TaxID=2502239 RepID=UPI0010F9BA88|nr:flavoprotein [Bacillus sp. E(2018)]